MSHLMHSVVFELLEPRRLLDGAVGVNRVANDGRHPAGELDMVLRWDRVLIEVLRADRTLPGPGWSSRNMAITSLAVFDTVNAFGHEYEPYLVNTRAPRGASREAAVAAAAHRALSRLYPDQQTFLDARLSHSLATVPDGPGEAMGVLLGRYVADRIVDARENDGSSDVVEYTPNPAPGHWEPDYLNPTQTAWGPGWGRIEPFALRSGDQFRAPPPPAIDSAAYARAFNEVKSLGEKHSTTRTAEQTEIGIFWAYDRAGTGSPPALYCQAVETIARQNHNTLVENARLLALVNVAMADAGITAWDSKYVYDYWRPISGIRRAGEDNNPLTVADPTWTPLGAPGDGPGGTIPDFTPPFPAYTSGHATFGAAVFKLLARFYGTDRMHFALQSDEMPGVMRSYDRFSQAAAENGRSRIYLGIHWQFDNVMGQRHGRAVADYVFEHILQRRGRHGVRHDQVDLHQFVAAPARATGLHGAEADSQTLPLTILVLAETQAD